MFLHITRDLSGKHDLDMIITRPARERVSYLETDDLLFRHILRADFRKIVWKIGFHARTNKDRHLRPEYEGAPEE